MLSILLIYITYVLISGVVSQDLIDPYNKILKALDSDTFRKQAAHTGFKYLGDICLYHNILSSSLMIHNGVVDDYNGTVTNCTVSYDGKIRNYTCPNDIELRFNDVPVKTRTFTLSYNIGNYYILSNGAYQLLIDDIFNCNDLDEHFCPIVVKKSPDNYGELNFFYSNEKISCYVDTDTSSWNCTSDKTYAEKPTYDVFHLTRNIFFLRIDNVNCVPTIHHYTLPEITEANYNNASISRFHELVSDGTHFLEKYFINNYYYCHGNIYNDNGGLLKTYNVTRLCDQGPDGVSCGIDPNYQSYVVTDAYTAPVESDLLDCFLPITKVAKFYGLNYALLNNNSVVELINDAISTVAQVPQKIIPFYYLPIHTVGTETFSEQQYTNIIVKTINNIRIIESIILSCVSNEVTYGPRLFYRHYICSDNGRSEYVYNGHRETYFSHGFDPSNTKALTKEFDVFFDSQKYYLRYDNILGFHTWNYNPRLLGKDLNMFYSLNIIILVIIMFMM